MQHWSDTDGTPPDWWQPEELVDGYIELGEWPDEVKAVFPYDTTSNDYPYDEEPGLWARLWGATLQARHRRLDSDRAQRNPSAAGIVRMLYGQCVENTRVLMAELEARGFNCYPLTVACEHDIEQELGGEPPESADKLSLLGFKHHLAAVVHNDTTYYLDISQYRFDHYDSNPYVASDFPDVYRRFDDSRAHAERLFEGGEVTDDMAVDTIYLDACSKTEQEQVSNRT